MLLLTQGAWGGGEGGTDNIELLQQLMTVEEERRTVFPCTSEGVMDAIYSFSPSLISCFFPTPITLHRSIILSNVSVDISGNNFLTLHGGSFTFFILVFIITSFCIVIIIRTCDIR